MSLLSGTSLLTENPRNKQMTNLIANKTSLFCRMHWYLGGGGWGVWTVINLAARHLLLSLSLKKVPQVTVSPTCTAPPANSVSFHVCEGKG